MADATALGRAEELLGRRQIDEALKAFYEAEAGGTDRDRCAGGRWLARTLGGDFEGAWRESDAIRQRGGADPHRFWNGEDVRGRRVILRCLHGLGDAVQMLRYAPRLKAECTELIVEVPPRFAELARCFAGVDRVITWDNPAPEWEVQAEVMELPYLFRTQLAELPTAERYLALPPEVRMAARETIGHGTRPKVGMVWAAGEWNRERNLPFALVERLVRETACEFWCLQGADEGSAWTGLQRVGLRDAAECGDGLMSLAGVVAKLDLVITVDTLAAHLAGALGTPAWVLLEYAADWRWMVGRDDSPWYPSLRLFRQSAPGDWEGLMARVCESLDDWLRRRAGEDA